MTNKKKKEESIPQNNNPTENFKSVPPPIPPIPKTKTVITQQDKGDNSSGGNSQSKDATNARSASSLKGNDPREKHIVVLHGFKPDPEGKIQSESRKLAFLDYFNDFLTPSHTAQAINVSLRTFYEWLEHDPRFKKGFHIVNRFLIDRYARMATSRAFRGSDNLLMFMLKANDPMYRDKVQAELDPKMIEAMAKNIVNALRRSVPDTCPHCKTNLGFSQRVELMLKNLGKGLPA